MPRRLLVAAITVIVAVPLIAVAASPAATRPKPKTVKVGDDFFSPKKLTVKRNTKITWKWSADNYDTHDVRLKKGPKGVKKFHSDLSASDYSFARTLTKPGKYVVICTIHAEMRQTIRVKR